MFAKAIIYTTAVFTALAAATPVPQGSGSCNTGPISCCNEVRSASDTGVTTLLGLLGVAVSGVDVLLGLDCSPISVVGVGSGSECSGSTVSCTDGVFVRAPLCALHMSETDFELQKGIGIGCVPVSL